MTSRVNGPANPPMNSPSPPARNSSSCRSASCHIDASFSLRRLGVISRISRARWSVCTGGSSVGSWSLIGSSSRCRSIRSVTSSPSSGTGKPGNGPVTEMQDENVPASWKTSTASSYPVTITTSWCGSRRTGHCSRRASKYGYGSATSSSPRKKSIASTPDFDVRVFGLVG